MRKECQFMASNIILKSVRVANMNCNLRFREERIAAILKVPRLSEMPSKRTFWVQCKGCRCLGVTDAGHDWHCFVTGEDLACHMTKVLTFAPYEL